ncbi:MAG: toll/interleukin-1 receptor domain-containing protein [Clostridia bacterium]|nr:toll/interleukin-1 receptor domain-containing protein [Clostridia bacterium]
MTNTDGKALFFAFISHKSCDSAIALRLQKFIEAYRLPTEIRKETGAPKFLAPICSYEIDFSSNPLKDEMDDKLSRSHYLILLCSKDLIKNNSKYVNYEIDTFIRTKREQGIDPSTRILPVIIDGEFDSPEDECCPDALKALGDKRPIGVNLKQYKNNREAFLHIISGMLDIDYAVLERRDKKRTKKTRITFSAVICLLLLCSCFLCEYFIPRKAHYLDFAMKNGLPVGIERLSRSEYTKINHYVITHQKHKIISLEYVNTKGNTEDLSNSIFYPDRPAIYRFDYNSGGLDNVTLLDKNGKPYFIQQYSGNNLTAVDFKDPADPTVPYYLGKGYESSPSALLEDRNIAMQGSVSRFQYQYSPDGYISALTFHRDNSGMPAEDSSVYGFEYVRDELGRAVEIYYLDALGNRRLNSEGIYCKKYFYNQSNQPVRIKNLDMQGNLTPDRYGVYTIAAEYNDKHQLISVSLLDADGNRASSEYYAYSCMQIDPETGIRMFFDKNEKPISDKGYCGIRLTYDDNGYNNGMVYLDENKNPVFNALAGYCSEQYENDKNGNPLRKSFFDTDGKPVNNADGYSEEHIEYNDLGLITKHSYYDKDLRSANYRDYGYSVQEFKYDDFGRELSVSYFGTESEPVDTLGPSFDFGYHKTETAYLHGANTKISLVYYDKDGNRTNAKMSSMGEIYSEAVLYTQNGVITSTEYFDKDGKPWGDITEYKVDYSPTAERIETAYVYDSSNNLIQTNVNTYNLLGVSTRLDMTEYGENGRVIGEASIHFDDSGKRKYSENKNYNPENGYPETEFTIEYNENEKSEVEIYINHTDADFHKSVTNIFYYPDMTLQREETAVFDINGTLRQQHNCFYDENGIMTNDERSFYENGKIKIRSKTKYHANGRWSEYTNTSFDENGLEKNSSTRTYDEDGNTLTDHTVMYTEGEKIISETIYHLDGTATRTTDVFLNDGSLLFSDTYYVDADGNRIK